MKFRPLFLGLLVCCGLPSHSKETWIKYGFMDDGTYHSWDKASLSQLPGNATFMVMSRTTFASPRPMPGSSSDRRMSVADIRYLINCPDYRLNAMSARYYDAVGGLVGQIDKAGPAYAIEPKGDKIRDRLFVSVCGEIKALQRSTPYRPTTP